MQLTSVTKRIFTLFSGAGTSGQQADRTTSPGSSPFTNRTQAPASTERVASTGEASSLGRLSGRSVASASPSNQYPYTDRVTLSPQGLSQSRAMTQAKGQVSSQGSQPGPDSTVPERASSEAQSQSAEDTPTEQPAPQTTQANSSLNLDQQELQQVRELKQRDTEVRSHEQAHLAAAGAYAKGGASFTYQKGPDGQNYAIGGEVGVDVSAENDPSATIQKMQTIKRAALAPADPSSADRRIAAQAGVKEARARQQLQEEQQLELVQGDKSGATSDQEQKAVTTPPDTAGYTSMKTQFSPPTSNAYTPIAIYA